MISEYMKKLNIIILVLCITGCTSIYTKSSGTINELISAFGETPKILVVTFLDIIQATMIYHEKNKRWPKDKNDLYVFSEKENIRIDKNKFKYLLFVPQSKKRLNIRFIAAPEIKLKTPIYLSEFTGIIGIYTPDPNSSIRSNNYIEIYISKIIYSRNENQLLESKNPFMIHIKNFDTFEELKVRGVDFSDTKGTFYLE